MKEMLKAIFGCDDEKAETIITIMIVVSILLVIIILASFVQSLPLIIAGLVLSYFLGF